MNLTWCYGEGRLLFPSCSPLLWFGIAHVRVFWHSWLSLWCLPLDLSPVHSILWEGFIYYFLWPGVGAPSATGPLWLEFLMSLCVSVSPSSTDPDLTHHCLLAWFSTVLLQRTSCKTWFQQAERPTSQNSTALTEQYGNKFRLKFWRKIKIYVSWQIYSIQFLCRCHCVFVLSKLNSGFRVAQWFKALHLSARGVTTGHGLISGCITTGRDWESHRAVLNWPSVIRVRVWPGYAVIVN